MRKLAALCLVVLGGVWLQSAREGAPLARTDVLGGALQQIAAREYWASPSGAGLQAPNRRHDLRTIFEPTGVRVHDRTANGSPRLLELRLSGVGRGDALAPVAPGEVTHRAG